MRLKLCYKVISETERKEREGCHHKVMLWAVDDHGQEVACEIKVVLQGN